LSSSQGSGPGAIADYGLIGDCGAAALVGADGSIDWLCWPRFDSEACFARLLGDESHGFWRIRPDEPFERQRRYRPGTLVLETLFETADASVALIDFMPPREHASHVVRIVEGRRGRMKLRADLSLRFGYGQIVPWVRQIDDHTHTAIAGPSMTVLRTDTPVRGEDLSTVAEFELEAGERATFVLSYSPSHLAPPPPIDPHEALDRTERFWRGWVARQPLSGPYAEAVERSLITLKAMSYGPTGGIVAAPTTSLPERYGGARNWDYRYSWIRDSTFTLLALMNTGRHDEAGDWLAWLHRAVAGDPADMQIMYGLAGERRLAEWVADWLPGYAGSKPVRIGNAAHGQFQLDVYGELMDTFHQARRAEMPEQPGAWDLQRILVDHVAKVWRQPDAGIWEVRGPPRAFTYSRVMAWVAIDRAVKAVEQFGREGPVAEWRTLRDEIRADVMAHGFDAARNTFVQAYGAAAVDASLLLLAQVGFVQPDDPAYAGTVAMVESELLSNGYVLRYATEDAADDGLPPGEAAFLACSFWLADAYALIGKRDKAQALFARLLGIRNDLGLLAEEYDPLKQRLAGNFPQAFSHIGLINTAANLSRSAETVPQKRAD
jgi:GH15 family glucan-1,4-alpha-glucosidase